LYHRVKARCAHSRLLFGLDLRWWSSFDPWQARHARHEGV